MTNSMIILSESIQLMKNGVIEGTGEFFTTDDGKQLELPEAIHTYQGWKDLGYQVQKGEKAIAKFMIWKHTTKKNEETGEEKSNMFMKKASFFKGSQVQFIGEE